MTKKISKDSESGHIMVNGLNMYYEIHGNGKPLLLLHGALSTIEIDFGRIIKSLAENRMVIAIEQQAHGHTQDIDRQLTVDQMADDSLEMLSQLGVKETDIFGYSMGAGIGLKMAMENPDQVSKLVVASVTYNREGLHHEVLEGVKNVKLEDLAGSPFQIAYTKTAPNPEDWPILIDKVGQMNRQIPNWTPENIKSIQAPTMIIIGDSDIVRPEHAVDMFKLLGGGVVGDIAGLPSSQLAILPGTTHITLVEQADWLITMITKFIDI